MISDLQEFMGPEPASALGALHDADNRSEVCNALGAPVPVLLFSVPPKDETFSRLTPELCQETWRMLARLKQIHQARKKTVEADRIAAALQRPGNKRGASAGTLLRLYYAYTRYGKQVGEVFYAPGDWRCVVDWAKAGPRARALDTAADVGGQSATLPSDFVRKVWHKLCDRHQRVISEAIRELLTIWQTGFDFDKNRWKTIAGYSAWPVADPRTGRPAGWGDRNLYRYAPDDFERESARIGIQSASRLGLKISKSRVGLKCLQFVQFDDHEFNVKVNFPGQLRSMRPRCFGAADVLTSRLFKMVSKPTFWDEGEEAKKVLTETDFMWFVVSVLCDEGYRTDTGSFFHVEHGTAALRAELAERISHATGGKVSVTRSGRFHKAAHGGQFAPPSGGNFRFKAIVEGIWRMIDDRLDFLPGQTGKDRLHAPEEMERADAYNARLLKAAAAMDPERAASLILGRFTYHDFCQLAFERAAALDADPQHEIEGWEKCKFVIQEFRAAPESLDWQPVTALAQLNPADAHALVARIKHDDRLYRPRRLSRFEAWQREYVSDRQAGLITRLNPELIPTIVGPRHALKCNGEQTLLVTNGVFHIEDSRIDPDPLEFLAQDREGNRLSNGSRFVCYLNPMAPHALIVCDKDHRVLSVCPPKPRPAAIDEHAVHASLGMQRAWYHRALAPVRARNAPDAAAIDFMKRHNAALLEGGKTEQEKQRSKTLKRARLNVEELLDDGSREREFAPSEVPEGRPTLAQGFNLGSDAPDPASPEGTAETNLETDTEQPVSLDPSMLLD